VADRPRLLARQAGRRNPQQYVDDPARALPHEPEAIDEATQARYAAESRRTFEVLKAEEIAAKATRSRTNRLKQLEAEARRRRVDVTRHVATIDRALVEMHRLVWPT
jgi:hypothetical protein